MYCTKSSKLMPYLVVLYNLLYSFVLILLGFLIKYTQTLQLFK